MNKSTWCQVEYENYITEKIGKNPFTNKKYYQCKYGSDCLGGHKPNEMILCKQAKDFNKLNYSEIDLLKFFDIMKNLIINNKNNLVNRHKELINKSNLNDFIIVLNLWYKFAFYYGKLSKDFKKNIVIKSKYKNIEDIPVFYFENDYIIWIIRHGIFHCEKHKKLLESLKKKKKISVFDICVGYESCKFGYHHDNNSFCVDDLMFKNCNCDNKNIKKEIKDLERIISDKKSDCTKISNELLKLEKDLIILKNKELISKRHLTYEGLKCYQDQVDNLKKKTEKKKVAKVCLVLK